MLAGSREESILDLLTATEVRCESALPSINPLTSIVFLAGGPLGEQAQGWWTMLGLQAVCKPGSQDQPMRSVTEQCQRLVWLRLEWDSRHLRLNGATYILFCFFLFLWSNHQKCWHFALDLRALPPYHYGLKSWTCSYRGYGSRATPTPSLQQAQN